MENFENVTRMLFLCAKSFKSFRDFPALTGILKFIYLFIQAIEATFVLE